jgi:hypothetical protein
MEARRYSFYEGVDEMERLRTQADYNTGSISSATCWVLLATANYFKPSIIAEVGTFIGKSTLSLLYGMRYGGVVNGKIYTCDFSNDIKLPTFDGAEIIQFPRQSSTDMFASISARSEKCDFLALDGRLQQEDFKFLNEILGSDSVIILDDFEGIEKGVSNAAALMNSLHRTHNLIYPPEHDLLRQFRLTDSCSTALIVPRKSFLMSNQ